MCQHFYSYIHYLCRPNFRVLCQHRHSSLHVLTRFTVSSCPSQPHVFHVHWQCATLSDFSFVSFHGAMYDGLPYHSHREHVFKETWRNLATCLVFWLISVLPCFQLGSKLCPLNSHLKRPFLPEHDIPVTELCDEYVSRWTATVDFPSAAVFQEYGSFSSGKASMATLTAAGSWFTSMLNQNTRELISAPNTSHNHNKAKTWVAYGNSHLLCV